MNRFYGKDFEDEDEFEENKDTGMDDDEEDPTNFELEFDKDLSDIYLNDN